MGPRYISSHKSGFSPTHPNTKYHETLTFTFRAFIRAFVCALCAYVNACVCLCVHVCVRACVILVTTGFRHDTKINVSKIERI